MFLRKIWKRKRKVVNAPAESSPSLIHKSKEEKTPCWEVALISSLKDNCLAPADEVILHAFDLYCEELNAPFLARQHKMAGLYSEIAVGIAQLQALAPDMVERAMARHPYELAYFIDQKKEPK